MNRPAPLALCSSLVLAFVAAEAALAVDKGCVWRLEGPGTVVYLAGSIHLLREQDHPLPPVYEKVYRECDRVYFEVDLETMKSPEGQATALRRGMLPQGEKLEDWLTPETMQDLQIYSEERGLPLERLRTFRPGMLVLTITNVEAMRMGAQPQFGVEALFERLAREDGKPVAALETVEFQMDLFNGMSRAEQERMLRVTLDDVEESAKTLEAMIRAWRAGDGVKLAEELNRNFEPQDAGLVKRLLYDRNEAWIPEIEKALGKSGGGNTLFIVGAGHLVGEKSVIALLEAKGHRPVRWTPE
ncbi:MAG: TraB/GumN family protein [Verrucomicrobia bacterium]|nr:TraB/GumN family protein [Verrucomicrobiota bacterium]